MMAKVLLPLAQGFEEIELVSIADVLSRGGADVILASLHSDLSVRGAHQIEILAQTSLQEISMQEFDAIVLHGGMEGVENMLSSSLLLETLRSFWDSKKLVGAICAAPLVLDHLGLLQSDFCCYPGCEAMMKNTQAKRLDLPYIFQDHLCTATGPAFAMGFGIALVEYLMGKDRALQVKNGLLYV